MFMDELQKQITATNRKDLYNIKKAEKRLKGVTEQDEKFSQKVKTIKNAMNSYTFYIADVLQNMLDNLVGKAVFKRPFSRASVISILQDDEFVAFLITSNLIKRVANLSYASAGQLKIRIYVAIITYDDYKKEKWCE